MSYLKQLVEEKSAREKQEKEKERMRLLISQIEHIVAQYDGEYLDKLERLNSSYPLTNVKLNEL